MPCVLPPRPMPRGRVTEGGDRDGTCRTSSRCSPTPQASLQSGALSAVRADASQCRRDQIPPDLAVKSQATDIIDIILQLVRRLNGVYMAWSNRKSRGELLSTSEVQWSTTKPDGVWKKPDSSGFSGKITSH